MELRRAADALVRSQGSPLAALLNPASTVRWTPSRQLSYKSSSQCQSRRSLSTTPRRSAIKPQPTTSSSPPPPEPETASSEASTYKPVPIESPNTKPKDDLASLTASLGWTNPSRLSPPPRRYQPPAWASSSLSSPREQRFNGGSSASDILAALNETRDRLNAARSSPPPSSIPSPRTGSSNFDVDRMAYPPSPFDPSSSPFSLSQDVEREARILKPLRVPIKLGPSTGRSVHIGAGIDIGRGFKLLEQSCARNGVKRDANNQRFHERPGLKRKRLRRERWRRKFLEGFKATVGRVKQLKNQGW
jgi:small subunit ribosomal protein MRP21